MTMTAQPNRDRAVKLIVSYCKRHQDMTLGEICEAIGLGKATLVRVLKNAGYTHPQKTEATDGAMPAV